MDELGMTIKVTQSEKAETKTWFGSDSYQNPRSLSSARIWHFGSLGLRGWDKGPEVLGGTWIYFQWHLCFLLWGRGWGP